MSGLNIDLLNRTVQWAIDKAAGQEKRGPAHDQRMWAIGTVLKGGDKFPGPNDYLVREMNVCGGSMCLAGDIVYEAGGRFFTWVEAGSPRDKAWNVHLVLMPGATEPVSISEEARKLLGVDDDGLLFSAGNTLEEIIEHASELADGHGEVLEVTVPDGFDVAEFSARQRAVR